MRTRYACLREACLVLTALAVIPAPAPRAAEPLHVFAAASLTEAFQRIAAAYEARHPEREVVLNLAGSQQLAAQIEHGAPADVFASADQRWMDDLVAKGLVAGTPRIFVRNQLVVVVPRGGRVARLDDLARPRVKVVLAADAVPVGRYSRQVLEKMGGDPAFGHAFGERVLANVVSEEESVKAVRAKVQLGEADAGIVYGSDVTAAARTSVRTIAIPALLNVVARYPLARLRAARDAAAADAFVDLVVSPEGQAILAEHGFLPGPPP